jgi:hypothetical protein
VPKPIDTPHEGITPADNSTWDLFSQMIADDMKTASDKPRPRPADDGGKDYHAEARKRIAQTSSDDAYRRAAQSINQQIVERDAQQQRAIDDYNRRVAEYNQWLATQQAAAAYPGGGSMGDGGHMDGEHSPSVDVGGLVNGLIHDIGNLVDD